MKMTPELPGRGCTSTSQATVTRRPSGRSTRRPAGTMRLTADIKRLYATASVVSADRIVFNIKGNDYRLIVAVDFEKAIVWFKWLGTHRDYDRIDARKVEHGD
ncbi:MAG: type II toxin-antitoxin system HigB family toxin [Alphaproteobacteria bacterium]|nr:type II toxin-antitoxin system HigB family toxin [Alphaproteobacteria bacterium]